MSYCWVTEKQAGEFKEWRSIWLIVLETGGGVTVPKVKGPVW